MTLEDIMVSVAPVYSHLRRPNGQLYSQSESQDRNNIHRRVKCALSANGLFENFDRPMVSAIGVKRKGKSLTKRSNLPTVNVWRVKEPQATDYLQQEILKFVSASIYLIIVQTNIKAKLNQRGRKLVIAEGQFLVTQQSVQAVNQE